MVRFATSNCITSNNPIIIFKVQKCKRLKVNTEMTLLRVSRESGCLHVFWMLLYQILPSPMLIFNMFLYNMIMHVMYYSVCLWLCILRVLNHRFLGIVYYSFAAIAILFPVSCIQGLASCSKLWSCRWLSESCSYTPHNFHKMHTPSQPFCHTTQTTAHLASCGGGDQLKTSSQSHQHHAFQCPNSSCHEN